MRQMLLNQALFEEKNAVQAEHPLGSNILAQCAPIRPRTSHSLPHIWKHEKCIPKPPKIRSLACPLP